VVKEQWDAYTPQQFNVVAGFDPEVWQLTMSQMQNWKQEAGSLELRDPARNIIGGSEKFLNTGGIVY